MHDNPAYLQAGDSETHFRTEPCLAPAAKKLAEYLL